MATIKNARLDAYGTFATYPVMDDETDIESSINPISHSARLIRDR